LMSQNSTSYPGLGSVYTITTVPMVPSTNPPVGRFRRTIWYSSNTEFRESDRRLAVCDNLLNRIGQQQSPSLEESVHLIAGPNSQHLTGSVDRQLTGAQAFGS